ncbi:uncharacterized protein LOC128668051 [Microplitis demolitor]|uniref:uncharacterized protein LOC128668051 n=1 Tax=Microplitis demolitor TaxID=69319 RepID=UPI00235B60A7|nr:uncharacterized protein LOC128668051 [Microplitis demolitor]
MSVSVPVVNPEIKQGYLYKIPLKEELLMGEALISVDDDQAMCMVINTRSDPAEIEIEPRVLKEFEFDHLDPSDEFSDIAKTQSGTHSLSKRDQYLLNKSEKSSSDQGDENTPEAINRQQMREDLRKSFERINKALEKRAINVSDEEADSTLRPEDYYNPLPVVSPQVAREVRKYLERGYLSDKHDESEDSDESDEEGEEESLRENQDIEENEDSSEVSCSEPEFQVEITPATPQAPRADEIRQEYLTAGRSPSTPMWKNTVLKAAQANCKEFDYDDHTKSFYWKDTGSSDDNTSRVIARPST